MTFTDKLRELTAPPHPPPANAGLWEQVNRSLDYLGAVIEYKNLNFPMSLYCGLALDPDFNHCPEFTPRDGAMLILAPPGMGKDAGLQVQNIILHHGPTASIGRDANWDATALVRSRHGQVSVVIVSTRQHIPTGANAIYFNPLEGCEDWETAKIEGNRWARIVDTSEVALRSGSINSGDHWAAMGGKGIAALFHYAALDGKDMGYVYDLACRIGNEAELKRIASDLEAMAQTYPTAAHAARELGVILNCGPDERGSIGSTIAKVLDVFGLPSVVEACKRGNATFRAFVEGEPRARCELWGAYAFNYDADQRMWGRYQTWYIRDADSEGPYRYAHAVILDKIRENAYAHTLECQRKGMGNPRPTFIANSEIGGAVPMHLRQTLAEMRQRGLMMALAGQSWEQIEEIFGRHAKVLLTLAPNLIVMPGLKDIELLRDLEALNGKFHNVVPNASTSKGGQGPSTTSGEGVSLEDILRVDQMAKGIPGAAYWMRPDVSYRFVKVPAYFNAPPWTHLLINSARLALQTREHFEPLPPLGVNADGYSDTRYLEAMGLANEWLDVQALWANQTGWRRNDNRIPATV